MGHVQGREALRLLKNHILGTEYEDHVFTSPKTREERNEEDRQNLFMEGVWSFSTNTPGPYFNEEKHGRLVQKLGGVVVFFKENSEEEIYQAMSEAIKAVAEVFDPTIDYPASLNAQKTNTVKEIQAWRDGWLNFRQHTKRGNDVG